MKLLIAIPALNEQDSIQSIIERSLEARKFIIANSPVTEVEITVVSDGSTDNTVRIASRYIDQIRLIVFERNQGYGAAIQEAWRDSDADLLGFLDADGTCEPKFFANLCKGLFTQKADIALGCRLNKETHMPLVRQFGNFLFASLLSMLSNRRVRDTASGMRVVRRETYKELLPLPKGLHFTPAMSARAILGLSGGTKLIEIDMPYHEREGVSKLRVVRDGIRFLRIILEALFLYRPSRPLAVIGLGSLVLAALIMASPVAHYYTTHSVEEWMIYRFILGHLAATNGFLLLSISILMRLIVRMTISGQDHGRPALSFVETAFLSPYFLLLPASLILIGSALVVPGILGNISNGITNEHWSRIISMSFFYLVALILICTRVVAYFLDLIAVQLAYSRTQVVKQLAA